MVGRVSMRKLSLPDRAFGDLLEYISDENITDINWSRGLWINHLEKGRYKVENFVLKDVFIQQFYTRISNLMNVQFNQNHPLLEAETDNLRISILHDSVTNTGISISIRKTPAIRRIKKDSMIREQYCTEEIDTFMENAIRAHCTVIVGGLPGVGKTEYIKYLTNYILPIKIKYMTYSEYEYCEINTEFEKNKDKYLNQTRQMSLLNVKEYDIIKDESYVINKQDDTNINVYTITVNKSIT